MRSRVMILMLASLLLACGGSDDADDTTLASDDTGDTGDEAPPPDDGSDEGEGDPVDEPEDEADDDGGSCLPVSRCHSFANQDCALVNAEGEIEGEAFSAGRVREACPGERGMSESIQECFNYVEISESCPRRMPDLREPAWPCGRNEDGSCGVQM